MFASIMLSMDKEKSQVFGAMPTRPRPWFKDPSTPKKAKKMMDTTTSGVTRPRSTAMPTILLNHTPLRCMR